MNRKGFLKGLFGAAVVAAMPKTEYDKFKEQKFVDAEDLKKDYPWKFTATGCEPFSVVSTVPEFTVEIIYPEEETTFGTRQKIVFRR